MAGRTEGGREGTGARRTTTTVGGPRRRRVRRWTLAALAALLTLGVTGPPASAVSSLENPPLGANDFACRPSAAHPEPVVLVHGFLATMRANWSYLSPLLKERGYCVFALTYGIDPRSRAGGGPGGVIPIEQSAAELGAFVDRVLAATGADRVDLVGHSAGSYMPQFWLKFLGGAARTDDFVAWTPLYDGTTVYAVDRVRDLAAQLGLDGLAIETVGAFCGSCPQFVAGSPMQRRLAEGGAAAPGVTYTTVMTRLDEIITPWSSGFMEAPEATNHVLQETCPGNLSEHVAVAFDPAVAQLTFNALDPAHSRPVDCTKLPAHDGSPAAAPGPDFELGVFHERAPITIRGDDENIGCTADGARGLRLASCTVEIRAALRGEDRHSVLGRGFAAPANRRSFKVDVNLTREGRKLLRRRSAGFRATLVATGIDDRGRTRTLRKRMAWRRG